MYIEQLTDSTVIENDVRFLKGEFKDLERRVNLKDYCIKMAEKAYVVHIKNDDKSELLGFAAIYVNNFTDKIAYLTLIGISPNKQRKGYGKFLLDHCITKAKECGMNQIRLEVDNDNVKGLNFYHNNGFVFESESGYNTSIYRKFI